MPVTVDQKFEYYLRKKNLKLTQERRVILDEMSGSERHFGPEELMLQLRDKGKRVSRATVYRTLDLLVDSGVVKKVCLGPQQFYYESLAKKEQKHSHLVCLKCGRIVEFSDSQTEERIGQICYEHGFRMTSRCFQVFGFCSQCK
jgi:Fur family ferric uptake transcriptional regulator